MADVVLQYRKSDAKGTDGLPLSVGQVLLRADDKNDSRALNVFFADGLSFADLFRRFADELRRYPEAQAVIERTDRGGLAPMTLEPKMAELLRHDTEAAIRSMQYVPAASAMRVVAEADALPPVLVVGHDAIADSFGDRLYCRVRRIEVECPVCGRWRPHTMDSKRQVRVVCCAGCGISLCITFAGEYWATVATEDLLALTPAPSRFFFPRGWNEGRNWIDHAALTRMYTTYVQEKNAS